MKDYFKKLAVLYIFFIYSLFAENLSEVKGLKKLNNYDDLKNIKTVRILEGEEKGERRNGIAYVKGEITPFSGILIYRRNGIDIAGIYFYENGRAQGNTYDYYDNGQMRNKGKNINDKLEGEGFEYYLNGKLKSKRLYKNNIMIESTDYYQNGKLSRIFKATEGLRGIITGYYEDGVHKNSEMSVIQDYSKKGEISYIMDGESTAYDKKGQIMGILNYKDGKLTGLEQKVFKNGKLKYDYISASEKPEENVKAKDFFIEYFDNSEQKKLDCKELASNNWRCKEYSKNGKFTREFDSPTFEKPRDWSFGINALLGILNILF